jgi:hypothetical protein
MLAFLSLEDVDRLGALTVSPISHTVAAGRNFPKKKPPCTRPRCQYGKRKRSGDGRPQSLRFTFRNNHFIQSPS